MTTRTKLINRRYRLERRLTLTDSTETWLGFDNVLHRAVAITLPRQELLRNVSFLDEFLRALNSHENKLLAQRSDVVVSAGAGQTDLGIEEAVPDLSLIHI